MQTTGLFSRLSKVFLCTAALSLLFAVFQPHNHSHSHDSDSHKSASSHACVVCKANNTFGGVPVISIPVAAFNSPEIFETPAHSQPAHISIVLTSSPARAPPQLS